MKHTETAGVEKRKHRFGAGPLLEFTGSGVAYSREQILALTSEQVGILRKLAADSPRGRGRICAHHAPSDPVHEMLIVVEKRSYLRPHMHIGKSESFHMIEGTMDIVIFSDEGVVTDVIPMSAYGRSGCFYYRLCEPRFHTLLVRSDWVLFHETTTGPFDPATSILAEWAPDEDAPERDIALFRKRMDESVRAYRAGTSV